MFAGNFHFLLQKGYVSNQGQKNSNNFEIN